MQSATDLVRQGQRLRYRHGQQRQGGSRGRGSRGGGSAGPRRGRGGGGPRTCYRCGLPGHIRRDCPQPADGDAPRPAGVAAGGRKRDRTPSAAAPHPGAAAAHLPPSQLLLVLSNADLMPLLLRWLPMDHMLVPPPVPRGPAVGRRGARPAAQPIGRRGLFDARAGLRHGQVSARLRSVRLGGREVAPVGPPAHRTSGPHPCVRPSPSLPLPCYARLHSLPAGAANCPLRVQRPRCLARTSTWRSRGSSCWVA